ncbi:MAG: helix-turn-helix transcriptional regulator [Bacillales bacterium]|jgi:DNA-binding Xre family transcriptional regulator|nr:helix-turn-helix transcriptional regulator [Bacillales bacterium]
MISYRKLWVRLAERDMKKQDLASLAHIAPGTISKLGRNENVMTQILTKICLALKCNIADIMNIIPDEDQTNGGNNK